MIRRRGSSKKKVTDPLEESVAFDDNAANEKSAKKRRRFSLRRKKKEAAPSVTDELLPKVPHADRFTFQDLVAEATADIGSRPGRLVMTMLGTVLGVGSLVATIGFAQTAAGQIASQFDAVSATQVVVKPAEASSGERTVVTGRLPWDAPERVERLAGVVDAALMAQVDIGNETITAVPVNDPSEPPQTAIPLLAASGGLIPALQGDLATGRSFDEGHDERGDRVAIIGKRAAERLGINRVDVQPSIFIGGVAYAVIGIVDDAKRRTDVLDSVIIPLGSARQDFGLTAATELQIQITVGAGPQVAEQSLLALSPDDPEKLEAQAPRSSSDLSQSVQADVNVVFLILGGIALLAGGLGIANVTLLSVMERRGEIGLRRALGATRKQIGMQFTIESIFIGFLGGLIGATVGVLGVVTVALIQQWTPIIDPLLAIGGAALGALVGWGSGWYPARKAAMVEPVAALRGS